MAFDTVGDYIRDARTLLQDRVEPYRYSSHSLVRALNLALLDVRRLRPDLFLLTLGETIPQYSAAPPDDDDDDVPEEEISSVLDEWVPFEQAFRPGIVDAIVAHALQRDQEDIQDERATGFMQSFENVLLNRSPTKGKVPPKV